MDISASITQPRSSGVISPILQYEPYHDDPMDTKPHTFGLKAQAEGTKVVSPYALYSSMPSPRLRIRPHLLHATPPDGLQHSIMMSWAATEPTTETKEYLPKFLEKLSVTINSRLDDPRTATLKGIRRFEVDLFGSVSWGGTTGQGSDVDLVLLVSHPRWLEVQLTNASGSHAASRVYVHTQVLLLYADGKVQTFLQFGVYRLARLPCRVPLRLDLDLSIPLCPGHTTSGRYRMSSPGRG